MATSDRLDFEELLAGVRQVEEIIQYRDGHLVRERVDSNRYGGSTTSSATSTAWSEGFEPDFAAEWNDNRPYAKPTYEDPRSDKQRPEWWHQRPQIVCDEAEYHQGSRRQSKQHGLKDTSRDSAIALGMQQHEYDQQDQAQRIQQDRRDSAFALQEQQREYGQQERAPRSRDGRQDSAIALQEQQYEYDHQEATSESRRKSRQNDTRDTDRDSAIAREQQQHEYDQQERTRRSYQDWRDSAIALQEQQCEYDRQETASGSRRKSMLNDIGDIRRDSAIALEQQQYEWDRHVSETPRDRERTWSKEKIYEDDFSRRRRSSSHCEPRPASSRRQSYDHNTARFIPETGYSRYSLFALPEEVPPPPYSPPRHRSSAITQETKEEAYGQRAPKPKKQIRAKEYEQQLRWLAGRRSLRRG